MRTLLMLALGSIVLVSIFFFGLATQNPDVPTSPQLIEFKKYTSPCPHYTVELYNPDTKDADVAVSVIFLDGNDYVVYEEKAYFYLPTDRKTTLIPKEYTTLRTECVPDNLVEDADLTTEIVISQM